LGIAEDVCDPANLERLFLEISDGIRQGKFIQWGRLAKEMTKATGLDWHNYNQLRAAVRLMNATISPLVGHMISVVLVNRNGLENLEFYEDAVRLGLLRKGSGPDERKRFWLKQWEWWQRWGQTEGHCTDSPAALRLRKNCNPNGEVFAQAGVI
jgi:hypothetical protein